jgi:hypothetical protein
MLIKYRDYSSIIIITNWYIYVNNVDYVLFLSPTNDPLQLRGCNADTKVFFYYIMHVIYLEMPMSSSGRLSAEMMTMMMMILKKLPLELLYLLKNTHQNSLGSFKDLSIQTDSGKRLCFILCYDYDYDTFCNNVERPTSNDWRDFISAMEGD